MARPTYTREIACNAPSTLWRVAGRVLYDRRLTLKEKREAWLKGGDLDVLAAALTCLKVDGEDFTPEWLEEQLTEQDVGLAFAYLLGGEEGVERHLKAQASAT